MSTSETSHRICRADAAHFDDFSQQPALVVTSPPYPMVTMWDEQFGQALENPWSAWEQMHRRLDTVWRRVFDSLMPGGFACINIGDATRTVDGVFSLFPNHSRIVQFCLNIGFEPLPMVHWNKPTNSPTKFMGSGCLPAGAYVTLEHEYILIFRKPGRRSWLSEEAKSLRRQSAVFWEERNRWFSDRWIVSPERQKLRADSRQRSAAFPLEIPWRLIHMYSVQGDLIWDPFGGTGTSSLAAGAAGRNSICTELEEDLVVSGRERFTTGLKAMKSLALDRLDHYKAWLLDQKGRQWKHHHQELDLPVVSAQERDVTIAQVKSLEATGPDSWTLKYN